MIKRRNEIGCDVCSLAFSEEVREPIVREENQSEDALIADLSIRALWEPEFSTCTYAVSYSNKSVENVSSEEC